MLQEGETAVGLYIHVPFCRRKCFYCDFYSVPVGASCEELVEEYIRLVEKEAKILGERIGPLRAATVYVGGGTPSLLSPKQFEGLVEGVLFHIPPLSPDVEFTVEANPESITDEKLRAWKACGVSRVSIGVQTFSERHLRYLGRIHNCKQAKTSVELAFKSGFTVNLDLIYSLPLQSLEDLERDVLIATGLPTGHISLYNLQIEEGTVFWRAKNRLKLPSEDEEKAMFEKALEILRAKGFVHYEISNFFRDSPCFHNLRYWYGKPYVGLGPSAWSYVGGVRWKNVSDIRRWADAISAGKLPVVFAEKLEGRKLVSEAFIMNLRLIEGVDLLEFGARFGVSPERIWGEVFSRLQEGGLIEVKNHKVRLTRRGILVANLVFEEFLA